MNPILLELVEQHWRQDLLRESARIRFMRKLQPEQPQSWLYASVLAGLGDWLIAWGWRLRVRYGKAGLYH